MTTIYTCSKFTPTTGHVSMGRMFSTIEKAKEATEKDIEEDSAYFRSVNNSFFGSYDAKWEFTNGIHSYWVQYTGPRATKEDWLRYSIKATELE